jgi:hypothetical protein
MQNQSVIALLAREGSIHTRRDYTSRHPPYIVQLHPPPRSAIVLVANFMLFTDHSPRAFIISASLAACRSARSTPTSYSTISLYP